MAKENPEQSEEEPNWRDKLRAWWHGDDYVMRHMVKDYTTQPPVVTAR